MMELGHLGLGTLVSVGDVPRTEDVLKMYVFLAALELVDGETVIEAVLINWLLDISVLEYANALLV